MRTVGGRKIERGGAETRRKANLKPRIYANGRESGIRVKNKLNWCLFAFIRGQKRLPGYVER